MNIVDIHAMTDSEPFEGFFELHRGDVILGCDLYYGGKYHPPKDYVYALAIRRAYTFYHETVDESTLPYPITPHIRDCMFAIHWNDTLREELTYATDALYVHPDNLDWKVLHDRIREVIDLATRMGDIVTSELASRWKE